MADAQVTLKVLLEASGIKPTTEQMKKLNAEMKKTAKGSKQVSDSANKVKRNLEGVSQRAGSTGKDFARMSQGMGGLVAAYATVAANVFALSAAFLVLRRTADLSSMIKSAEDFSNRFGVSVTRITSQLQRATGGALSFADALPVVNKAVSAGVPIEKMEELAVAATKAAQTFGGSATEALNRFISAAQRGRVEIIQTLGIVIKTEKAYKDYAVTIGKTALELSAFDRQQAILNATITASQSVFDGVNIDPNPFQQLLTTVTDLKDTIGVFITDAITPLLNSFNKSKAAAAGLIALIISMVAGRIFPALTDQIDELQKKSFASTKNATAIMKKARAAQTSIILTSGVKQNKLTKDQLLKRSKLFNTYFAERLAQHKTFGKSILDNEKKINAAILNERRAAITRELNLRAKGGGSDKFIGVPSSALENERNRLILLTKETKNATAATAKLAAAENAKNSVYQRSIITLNRFTTGVRANVIAFKAQLTTGFQRSFAQTQQSFILGAKLMGRSWGNFIKIAITQSKGASLAFAAFGRSIGKTIGFIAGAFATALSIFSSLIIVISIGILVWEKFGDKLRGITPEQRAVRESTESFKEGLIKANEVLAEGIELWGDKAPSSLKDFADSFTFVAGTFETIANEITQLNKGIISGLEGITVQTAIEELRRLKAEAERIRATPAKLIDSGSVVEGKVFVQDKGLRDRLIEINPEVERLQSLIDQLAETTGVGKLANQFSEASKFANTLGIDLTQILFESRTELLKLTDTLGKDLVEQLTAAASAGDFEKLIVIFKELRTTLPSDEVAELALRLKNFFSTASGEISVLNRTSATALRQLQELGGNFNTFVLGLDRLRSQKSPFKDMFGFIIQAENALKDLVATQKISSNTTLEEAFAAGDLKVDLESINQLLGGQNLRLKDALIEATRLREVYRAQLEVQLLGSQQLKVLALDLSEIKAREIRSDLERSGQVLNRTQKELEIIRKKGDLADSNLQAAQAQFNTLDATGELQESSLAIEQIKIDILQKELDILNEQESRLLKFTEYRLELLAIDQDILNNLKSRFSLANQIAVISKKLVTTQKGFLSLSADQFEARRRTLSIEKQLVQIELKRIQVRGLEGELARREIAEQAAKLVLLERQTQELERQQESRFALQEEEGIGKEGPVTIFSQRAIDLTAHFFRRALEKEIPKLKSTFEVLGVGFSKNLIDTFDKAIDNLLEGGKDFGRTIIETLKAGLRDTIGNALKNDFKKIFLGVGKDFIKILNPEKAAQAAADAQIAGGAAARSDAIDQASKTATVNHLPLISASLTQVIPEKLGQQLEELQGISTGIDTLQSCACGTQAKEAVVDTSNIGKDVATKIGDTPLTVDTVGDSPTVQGAVMESANLISAVASENSMGIIQSIVQLGTIFISAFTASQASDTAGGVIAAFANANGGVMSGGMSKPIALASGGVIKRPSVALIGEGKNSEAVVPLPNNREIPVEMRGETGDNISIEQNFDFTNANTDTIATLRGEARAIEERTFNRVFSEINKGGKYAKIAGRRK